jgi:hypothetical protein
MSKSKENEVIRLRRPSWLTLESGEHSVHEEAAGSVQQELGFLSKGVGYRLNQVAIGSQHHGSQYPDRPQQNLRGAHHQACRAPGSGGFHPAQEAGDGESPRSQVLLTIDEARANHLQTLEQLSKEKQTVEQGHRDLIARQQQERQREEEAHSYQLAQKRKADQDAWTEQVRVRGNQERDRQEAFEKNIVTREEALRLKETQYNEALTKAQSFDNDVVREADKRIAIATNSLKKDFEHQTQMTHVKHESEVEKLRYDNTRLVQAANNYETQVKELQAALKSAHESQTQLAKDAVAAAANKQAQADALALVTNIGGGNGQARPRS